MSSNQGPSRAMRSPAAASSSSSSAAQSQQHQQRSQHAHQHQGQPSQQHHHGQKGKSSFTAEMRDRQSRGKDPYVKEIPHPDDDDEDDDLDDDEEEDDDMDLDDEDEEMDDDGRSRLRIGGVPKTEGFEERERRQFALSVLDSPEQLMMYAQSTNDSIPGQRYRFMSQLCGFEDDELRGQSRVRRR